MQHLVTDDFFFENPSDVLSRTECKIIVMSDLGQGVEAS